MRHFYNDLSIVLGGAAGTGVQTVEAIVIGVLKREGFHVFASKEYMSRIRGGSNSTEIRLGSEHHRSYVRRIDFLFAMDGAVVPHLRWRITPGTIVFGESGRIADKGGIGHFVDVPFGRMAEEAGNKVYANSVAAGVAIGILDASEEALHGFLKDFFARKGEAVVEGNIEAARRGYAFGRHVGFAEDFEISLQRGHDRKGEMLIDGTTAIGIGALAGGCNFISSYPMSPATGVLTLLAKHGGEHGVVVDQAEDEISAINMALGASYAGARAMVTTSGGGFDLMQEGVSLAGIIETPIVIHIGMRPGPATGLPTRTEQGDLDLALHAGHGDFSRVIYAPGTLEEGVATTRLAFDMAGRFQIPAFVLTDQLFLDSISTMSTGAVERGALKSQIVETDQGYARYRLTGDGISPRGIPGWGQGIVKVDSDEHDEAGHITESYEMRRAMMEKRMRRLETLRNEALLPTKLDNYDEAGTIVIAWGSNRGVLEEALRKLRSPKLGGLHFAQVYPVNPKVKRMLARKKIIILENNHSGQFADLLVRELGVKVSDRILKSTGEPFCVEEVTEDLRCLI